MASIKDLKKRIGTVKNTQQTTRAMKMVSAAKLRRSQDAIINQRPYARSVGDLIQTLSATPDIKVTSPLIRKEKNTESGQKKKLLLVLVTSDRGLCGGFNSNVIKTALRFIKAQEGEYAETELGFVGRRGYEFFRNKKYQIGPYFAEQGGKVTFLKAKQVADILIERYLNSDLDEIKIVYNEFKNAVTQKTLVEDFLPLRGEISESKESSTVRLVKPSAEVVLEQLLKKNFAIQTFRVLLESQAGEHGARMSAMENATKNAGEMIKKLTLQFNKQRQAGITKELLEIISGSESQKASA